MFRRGPGEGYVSAKASVLKLLPTAVCVRRQFGSLKGWVVYHDGSQTPPGVAAAAMARDAWNAALAKLTTKAGS
jgi:hypothetical protein